MKSDQSTPYSLRWIQEKQRTYLHELQLHSLKPLLVQVKKKGIWRFWGCPDNNRIFWTHSIPPNCVLIELDDSLEVNIQTAFAIIEFLDKEQLYYTVAWSGNKSIHIMILFDFFDLQESYWDTTRKAIAEWIIKDSGIKNAKIDKGKINFNSLTRGSMVRCFGWKRRDGGYKTYIPNLEIFSNGTPHDTSLMFPPSIVINTIPTNSINTCVDINTVDKGADFLKEYCNQAVLEEQKGEAIKALEHETRVNRHYQMLKGPRKVDDRSGSDYVIVKCLVERGFHKEVIKSVLSQTSRTKMHEGGKKYFDRTYANAHRELYRRIGISWGGWTK